jgi:hypothetical protein
MKRRELFGASAATLAAALMARGDTETQVSRAQRLHMAILLLCLNKSTYLDFTKAYTTDAHGVQYGPPKDPNLLDIANLQNDLFKQTQTNLASYAATFPLTYNQTTVASIGDLFYEFALLISGTANGTNAAYGGPDQCPCAYLSSCTTAQRLI